LASLACLNGDWYGELVEHGLFPCGNAIARYDGFIARYVGDGILAYFGWPTKKTPSAQCGRP
jgi:hypothetical protein